MTEEPPVTGAPSPRRARATMRDVAALAGVGVKTVSRVVNGEPDVSAAMVARVNEAARKLNFQPDLIASNLRRSGRRSLSVGLVLAAVDNPFSATVHRAVEAVAETEGVAVFAASTDERPERERRTVRAFVARRVDGLIIMPVSADQGYLRPEVEAGTPIVAVDRPIEGFDLDYVATGNELAARNATEHLLAGGHRRIAFVGDRTTIATATQRLAGYRAAMAAAGLPPDPQITIMDRHDEATAADAVGELMKLPDPPTAIFAGQNLVTRGSVRALHQLGLQHRVAFVGFDEISMADLLDPPLTLVAQDTSGIGRIAAERMFARIKGERLEPEHITVPAHMIVRGSGEIPPYPKEAP